MREEVGNFQDLAQFDQVRHQVLDFQQVSNFDRSAYKGPLGIDLAMDTSDVVEELRGSRIDFVARYYRDPTSSLPALSSQEARKLASLGLKIVAVWEQNSPDPENLSYSSGYSEAFSAYEQAKAIGQPAGSAIYFAIDFNAHELEPAKEYFRGRAVPACSPPRWKTPGSSQSASRRGSAAIPGIPVCRALTNRLRRGDLARWRCCRLPDGRRPPPEARAAFAAAAARLATAGIALADRHADPVIEEVEGAIADSAQLTRTINAWEAHTGCYVKCSAIGLLKREGYRTQSRNFIPKIVSQAAVALGKVVSRLVNRFDLPREAVAEQPLRVIRAGARLDMQ